MQFQKPIASTLVSGLLIFTCLLNHADGQATSSGTDYDDLSLQQVLEMLQENASSLTPISLDYTHQLIPSGDPAETLAELGALGDDPFKYFTLSKQRLKWSDGRVYFSQTMPQVEEGVCSFYLWEVSYTDGVQYDGSRFAQKPVLMKRPATQVDRRVWSASVVTVPYLKTCGYDPLIWSDQQADHLELRSWIPYTLDSGGTLEGIQTEDAGEHSGLVRIEIIGPNPVRMQADLIDLEAAKRALATSRETPERQKELIKQLEERKSVPPTRNYTFWLDPEIHFAIRAIEERNGEDQLLVERTFEEFEQLPERNVWLPRLCTVRHFSFDSVPLRIFQSPIVTEEFRVSSIDPSPVDASLFVVEYTDPGAEIHDLTSPDTAIGPSGIQRTVTDSEEEQPLKLEDVRRPTNSFWPWFVGSNVILLIALAGFLGWRYMKHA